MSRNTRKLADLLHKGTIVALVGLTCYGMGLTGLRIYDYFAILRPATLERKRLAEKKLLESTSEDNLKNYRGLQDDKKPFGWSLGKLNHVAIATPNLEQATALYRDILGAKVSDPLPLPEHGVTTVFVELGNTKLELLLPLGADSPIKGFLEKNKSGGLHHICIEVDNIEEAMKHLKSRNIRCLSETTKIGAHGKPVVFLHPKDCSGVLVELEQA